MVPSEVRGGARSCTGRMAATACCDELVRKPPSRSSCLPDETTGLWRTREAGQRVTREQAERVADALDRFEGPLLLYAERLLRDPHGARDCVQEAFLRLLERDPAEEPPRLPAWLYAVCRNLVLDRMRRAKVMERSDSTALEGRADIGTGAGVDPAVTAGLRDDAARALRELDALPEKQREVLRLRFGHGLRYRDIAEVTGLSVSHVGVLVHHGLRSLRQRCAAPVDGGTR